MPSFIVYLSTFAILLSLLIHIFQYKTQTSNTSLSDIPLAQILTFHTSNTSNLQNSPKNNKIAFGYASDLDIVVNALELIYSLNLNQSVLPNPFHHQSLTNKSQFIETLAYFFQKGSGVEFYLENQKDFEEIITKSLPLAKIKDLGGNGAVMALRGYQEGINVLLGCNIDKKSYLELFDSKIELVSEITDIMTDIHLVLDFTEGEQWGPLVCPRSNRFYVNHDVLNTELKLLDVFHERIKEFRPDIVSVGGLHLFNDFEETKIKEVFERVGRKLAQDKEISKIHVEMGSFTNEFIVHSLVGSVFPHVSTIFIWILVI